MKTFKHSFCQTALLVGGFVSGVSLQAGDNSGLAAGLVVFIGAMMLSDGPKLDNYIEAPVTTSRRVMTVVGMALVTAVAFYAVTRLPGSTKAIAHATGLLC